MIMGPVVRSHKTQTHVQQTAASPLLGLVAQDSFHREDWATLRRQEIKFPLRRGAIQSSLPVLLNILAELLPRLKVQLISPSTVRVSNFQMDFSPSRRRCNTKMFEWSKMALKWRCIIIPLRNAKSASFFADSACTEDVSDKLA